MSFQWSDRTSGGITDFFCARFHSYGFNTSSSSQAMGSVFHGNMDQGLSYFTGLGFLKIMDSDRSKVMDLVLHSFMDFGSHSS